MKKLLFLIHDLGYGGAEKVLVNLVNHLDRTQFDITVIALFGGGVNEQFLKPDIHFRAVWPRNIPGNSKWMKLLSPAQLHRFVVKETYDVEIAYLEGPSTRVISGCPDPNTQLVCWLHSQQKTCREIASSFRTQKEAICCYNRYDRIIAVSQEIKDTFGRLMPLRPRIDVLYNTNETDKILQLAAEKPEEEFLPHDGFRIVGVGRLVPVKGFDRLVRIQKKLLDEGYPVGVCLLGEGPEREALEHYAEKNGLRNKFVLMGYQTNPYKYVARCDLFVCTSYSEGFSTAATEALIVGTPVCTVEVSGMKEMLGAHNEYGIVTENEEDALYHAIKSLLDDPQKLQYYRERARERGKMFCTQTTVRAVEQMLLKLESQPHTFAEPFVRN